MSPGSIAAYREAAEPPDYDDDPYIPKPEHCPKCGCFLGKPKRSFENVCKRDDMTLGWDSEGETDKWIKIGEITHTQGGSVYDCKKCNEEVQVVLYEDME